MLIFTINFNQADYWWLRSPYTGRTYYAWYVYLSGIVDYYRDNVWGDSYGKNRSPSTYVTLVIAFPVHPDGNVDDNSYYVSNSCGRILR